MADRAELDTVSAQIIDFESARALGDACEKVTEAAAYGMSAFKARFQQNQNFNARVDAERERMASERHRVAQERSAIERQEKARAASKQIESDQLSSNDGLSKGRSGPDFGM